MRRSLHHAVTAAGLLSLLSGGVLAQTSKPLPYNPMQVEPDQDQSPLGVATEEFKGIHVVSAQVRGVRMANGEVYWVSANQEVLSAYHGNRLLWQVNVAQAFQPAIAQPRIEKLVLASNVVFVFTNQKGAIEVERESGKLSPTTIYK